MTNIIKDFGSISNIKFKGLGDPGPFSFSIIDGTLPDGTTFNPTTLELTGTFTKIGTFTFTVQGKKKDRIESKVPYTITVQNFTLIDTDFKSLTDKVSGEWTPLSSAGYSTKITDDSGLLDSECYEITDSDLYLNLIEPLGLRDFKFRLTIKFTKIINTGYYTKIFELNGIQFGLFANSSLRGFRVDYNGTLLHGSDFLIIDEWFEVIVIRLKGITSFYIDGEIIFSTDTLFTLTNKNVVLSNRNTSNVLLTNTTRLKQVTLVIDKTLPVVSNVIKYKLTGDSKIFLNSKTENDYSFTSNYNSKYTVRVNENYQLPTGLVIQNHNLVGSSTLEDNLSIGIDLIIDGVVHDTKLFLIEAKDKTIEIVSLPLTGDVGSTVFGDTLSRQWVRTGDVKVITDTDNLKDGVSTFFELGSSLHLDDSSFKIGLDDCEYSFWFKRVAGNAGTTLVYLLYHGYNATNGLLLFSLNQPGDILTVSGVVAGGYITILSAPIVNNTYNHIKVTRINNYWSLKLNNILVSERYYEYSLDSDRIMLSTPNWGPNAPFKGSVFDLKISKYNVLSQSAPVLPNTVKWGFYLNDLVYTINSPVNEQITTNWYYSPVTYQLNENSVLPLGVTLSTAGVIEGRSNLLFNAVVLIDCYIDNILNRTISFNFIIQDKQYFLTHSIKTLKDSIEIINEKGNNTVTVSNVNVASIPNIGAMINFELGSPRDPYTSYISIPDKEFDAIKKSFCFEALFYLSNKDNIFGFQRLTKEFSNVLFSKSSNYTYETSVGLNNINDLLVLFFYSGHSYTNPVSYNKNTNLTLSTLHHVAVTYDLTFLRFFIDGIQVSKIPWNGFQSVESNPLYIGGAPHTGYTGHQAGFNGYLNDIKLYQNSPIYTENFTPDLNFKLSPDFPIIEPNIFYTGKINGVTNQTVSIASGVLPNGLSINNKGVITGVTNVTKGVFPITLTVVDGLIIEHIDIVLNLAKLVLDLDFSLPIVNGKIKDKLDNEFIVIGNPTVQTNSNFSSNKSLYLNGTDSWLKLPVDKVFKLGKLDFVIEFELILNSDVKINGGNYPGIISQRNDSLTDHAFSIELCGGSTSGATLAPESVKNAIGLMISNSGSIVSGNSKSCYGIGLLKDTKYKIKFIKKDGNIKLFVDDVFTEAVKIANGFFSIWNSNQDLLIGCLNSAYSTNRLFHGHIGYMKIYTGTVEENDYNNTGYIYYRLEFLESAGSSNWIELQEIELATSIGAPDVSSPDTLVTASSWWSSGGEQMHPSGLVDNNLINPDTNAWSQAHNTLPAWVEFQLETPKDIKELRILTRNKAGYESRGPKSFKVTGSNDGFVYNEIATFSNVINWNSNWKAFNLLEGTYHTP